MLTEGYMAMFIEIHIILCLYLFLRLKIKFIIELYLKRFMTIFIRTLTQL